MEEDGRLGFKLVTAETVLDTDPVVATMATLNHETGEVRAQEPGDWLRFLNAIELEARVPYEVRRAFMFSRGALSYAHWYYPALTLGMNDMLRIAEFAVSESCRERGINQPAQTKKGRLRYATFSENITALNTNGIIRDEHVDRWKMIRDARNRATHPATQSIYGFAQAHKTLQLVETLINDIEWM